MVDEAATVGIVENLVTQFSNALDCFRELVQNSIDSGSGRVEVWGSYEEGEGHEGVISFHVDDFGEGMDENVIDQQLTRLFSSTKEDDLTKIGKFGIGFVSVFAMEPKAVLVHTGRGGEYWEVLFHEDRSFSKTRLDVPVEGTQITIFREGDYHAYQEMVEGVRATLKRWCAHSETEVTFEDRSPQGAEVGRQEVINEPFELEGDCLTHAEFPGTEIVLAYTVTPIYGFYNRGLTLALSEIGDQVFDRPRSLRYRRIAVKIKSRYLEHTLSRETVMRDENYSKAMALLDGCADGQLFERLKTELESLASRESWGLAEMERYGTLVSYAIAEREETFSKLMSAPVLRGALGKPLTPNAVCDVFHQEGWVLLSEQPTGLVEELNAQGIPVVLGRAPEPLSPGGVEESQRTVSVHPLDAVCHLIRRAIIIRREGSVKGRALSLIKNAPLLRHYELVDYDPAFGVWKAFASPERVYIHAALDERVPEELRALLDNTKKLLKAIDAGYKKLRTFRASKTADAPFFVTGRKLAPLMAHPALSGGKGREKRLEVAVNRSHQHFEALLRLHHQSPKLASFCLAKALLLSEDRLLDSDVRMMEKTLERGRA